LCGSSTPLTSTSTGGCRFVGDGLEFDLIAPSGMGGRADLTTIPPLRAPQLAGKRWLGLTAGPVQARLLGLVDHALFNDCWVRGACHVL
jgi:hypothetical protein